MYVHSVHVSIVLYYIRFRGPQLNAGYSFVALVVSDNKE